MLELWHLLHLPQLDPLVEQPVGDGPGLILYADGLTDVMAPDGQLYDLKRFRSLLLSHAGLCPDELCDAVSESLEPYQGGAEQFDDMTMPAIEVT